MERKQLHNTGNPNAAFFPFRLETSGDGTQIIDNNRITYMDSLTPLVMMDYMQAHESLYQMERLARTATRKSHRNSFERIIKAVLRVVA